MNNKTSINLKMQPTLDRGIIVATWPLKTKTYFTILFNKVTTAIQFKTDPNFSLIKENKIKNLMFRNLENCPFCKTFLILDDKCSERSDVRGKFAGVNRLFEKNLIQFHSEKLDLNSSHNNSKPTNNYLLTLGWRIHGMEDDLLFYFVQRKCYNTVTRTNVIRSAALQFSTERGIDCINKYQEKNNEEFKRVDKFEFLDESYTVED
jgi:hypothetical protein